MFTFLVTVFFLAFSSPLGAAQTQLHGVWYDPNFKTSPIKKVLVIGLSDDKDKRKEFETTFVSVIREGGGQAWAGEDVLPKEKTMEMDTIKKAIDGKGFDAVLISRLISVDENSDYVPGTASQRSAQPSNPYQSSFNDEYKQMYNTVYTPGYLVESKTISIQNKIYSKSGKLIWSGDSESVDPASMLDLVKSMGQAMQKDLAEKGLIAPKKK